MGFVAVLTAAGATRPERPGPMSHRFGLLPCPTSARLAATSDLRRQVSCQGGSGWVARAAGTEAKQKPPHRFSVEKTREPPNMTRWSSG